MRTVQFSKFVFNLMLLHVWIHVAVTQNDLGQQLTHLQNYLTSNGFMSETDEDGGLQDITQAIIDLQTMLGLEPTGVADGLLLAAIDSPRCGMADRSPQDYRVASTKFQQTDLTYWIKDFPPFLTADDVRMTVRDAFQVWADVTPLSFQEVYGPQADIVILFASRDHGDGAPFDGPGGVLAHAYLPLRSDAHFDGDEQWTIGTFAGTNLFQVAAHEFGHSLGLFHSEDISALMYPYYRGYQANFQLGEDDKEGIRSLYGREVSTSGEGGSTGDVTTTPAAPPAPQQPPPLAACLRNGTFDAVANTADGRTYGFIGRYVWRLDDYPHTYAIINAEWQGLPNFIQAAVTQGNVTYIFKRCFVWMYQNREYMGRMAIRDQWPGLPCNVQAGYVSPTDGYTYFFKGFFVYRFRGSTLQNRRRIWNLNWDGMPVHNLRVTAINPNINNEGLTTPNVYLFTGNIYYLFDDAEKRFMYPSHYPREVNRYILNTCPSS